MRILVVWLILAKISRGSNDPLCVYVDQKSLVFPGSNSWLFPNFVTRNIQFRTQRNHILVIYSVSRYMCGFVYYQLGNRYYPSDCPDCVVVHNNWIVSHEAKIYRFNEHLTWMYEEDSYYSSTSRKYLVYKNPITWSSPDATIEEELGALKAALALGKMLNRTVILPRFHKQNKEIPLNGLLSIADFDKVFHDQYRENSFLHHPWVPTSLKSGQGEPVYSIITGSPKTINDKAFVENTTNTGKRQMIWKTFSKDIPEKDILQQYRENGDLILEFVSLYGLNPRFSRYEEQTRFDEDVKKAFIRRGYGQQIWSWLANSRYQSINYDYVLLSVTQPLTH